MKWVKRKSRETRGRHLIRSNSKFRYFFICSSNTWIRWLVVSRDWKGRSVSSGLKVNPFWAFAPRCAACVVVWLVENEKCCMSFFLFCFAQYFVRWNECSWFNDPELCRAFGGRVFERQEGWGWGIEDSISLVDRQEVCTITGGDLSLPVFGFHLRSTNLSTWARLMLAFWNNPEMPLANRHDLPFVAAELRVAVSRLVLVPLAELPRSADCWKQLYPDCWTLA